MAQYNDNMNTHSNMAQEKAPQPMINDGSQYPMRNISMSPPPPFSAPVNPTYNTQQPPQAYTGGYDQQHPQMAYNQPQHPPSNQYMGPQQTGSSVGAGGFTRAVAIPNLGMGPAPVDCPGCGQRSMTNIQKLAGNTIFAWSFCSFWFTGCCCWIPFMIDSLKDVQHKCGNCGALLATWHNSGRVDVHMHP